MHFIPQVYKISGKLYPEECGNEFFNDIKYYTCFTYTSTYFIISSVKTFFFIVFHIVKFYFENISY